MEFFYSNTVPAHEAGVLLFGHNVLPSMIIPPKTDNYLIEGFCSGQCTEKVKRPIILLRYDCHMKLLTHMHCSYTPLCDR